MNEQLVSNIENFCTEKNFSIAQLESEFDFKNETITSWKEKSPTLDQIIQVADFFNCSIDELVGNRNSTGILLKANNKPLEDLFLENIKQKTELHKIIWKEDEELKSKMELFYETDYMNSRIALLTYEKGLTIVITRTQANSRNTKCEYKLSFKTDSDTDFRIISINSILADFFLLALYNSKNPYGNEEAKIMLDFIKE